MSAAEERAAVWQAIEANGAMLGALEERVETIPGQLDAIRADLDAGRERFEGIEKALAENTALTKTVADQLAQHSELLADIARAQVFARTVGRVVAWVGRSTKRVVVTLGALAGAAWALWTAFYALTHGGKGP